MKKLSILFMFSLTIVSIISSYGNNDSSCIANDYDHKFSVIGKWEFIEEGTIVDGQEYLKPYNGTECGKDYSEFLIDGSYKEVFFDKEDDDKCASFNRNGQYTKDGSTLVVTGIQGQSLNFEILTLDEHTLKIKLNSKIFILKKFNSN